MGKYVPSTDRTDRRILRDLPTLYGIQDIQELNRLFTTLAYNTGREVTLEELSHSSELAENTLRRYLDYLEAAFLLRRTNRVDGNAQRFTRITSFKVYLTNPSMRGALFGYVEENSPAMGTLCETAVFSQMLHTDVIDWPYYARWKRGEVDLIHLRPHDQKPSWGIEVKWSDRAKSHDEPASHLASFYTKNSLGEPAIVTAKRCEEYLSLFSRPQNSSTPLERRRHARDGALPGMGMD